jgi:hypothetical protein
MSADLGRDLVFISYSHTNPVWRDRLLVLLKPFVRRGELQVWVDTDIEAGALWRREIDAALARTCVGCGPTHVRSSRIRLSLLA